MPVTTLKDLAEDPQKFFPIPKEGIEVQAGLTHSFWIYPKQVTANDKLDDLARKVVEHLEPRLITLKNFPISTRVTIPQVMCSIKDCKDQAQGRFWVTNDSGRFVQYLCEEHINLLQSEGSEVEEDHGTNNSAQPKV